MHTHWHISSRVLCKNSTYLLQQQCVGNESIALQWQLHRFQSPYWRNGAIVNNESINRFELMRTVVW